MEKNILLLQKTWSPKSHEAHNRALEEIRCIVDKLELLEKYLMVLTCPRNKSQLMPSEGHGEYKVLGSR